MYYGRIQRYLNVFYRVKRTRTKHIRAQALKPKTLVTVLNSASKIM